MSKTTLKRPLSIDGVSCLFSDPKTFFSGAYNLKHVASLLVMYFIWSNSGSAVPEDLQHVVAGQASSELMSSYLKPSIRVAYGSWELGPMDLFVQTFSSASFFIICFMFFFLRALYCGVIAQNNLIKLGAIYLYSEAVFKIPLFCHRLLQALVYSDPVAAAFDTNQTIFLASSAALNIMSSIVAYQAMQTVFGLSGIRTRLWFRDIPILICLIGFGIPFIDT